MTATLSPYSLSNRALNPPQPDTDWPALPGRDSTLFEGRTGSGGSLFLKRCLGLYMIPLTEIFSLLTEHVPNQPASELLEVCKAQMKEFPYVDTGIDKNLPAPVRGYKFTFKTDDEIPVMLEIHDSKGITLQASFRIVYPGPRASDVFENHLDVLLHLAEDSISTGNLSKVKNVDLYTFTNDKLLVIISTSSFNNQDIITVSVGNEPMWG